MPRIYTDRHPAVVDLEPQKLLFSLSRSEIFNFVYLPAIFRHYPVHMVMPSEQPSAACVRPSSELLLLLHVGRSLCINREPLADIKLRHYSAPATLTCLSLPHLCTNTSGDAHFWRIDRGRFSEKCGEVGKFVQNGVMQGTYGIIIIVALL